MTVPESRNKYWGLYRILAAIYATATKRYDIYTQMIDAVAEKTTCSENSKLANSGMYRYKTVNKTGNDTAKAVNKDLCSIL